MVLRDIGIEFLEAHPLAIFAEIFGSPTRPNCYQ